MADIPPPGGRDARAELVGRERRARPNWAAWGKIRPAGWLQNELSPYHADCPPGGRGAVRCSSARTLDFGSLRQCAGDAVRPRPRIPRRTARQVNSYGRRPGSGPGGGTTEEDFLVQSAVAPCHPDSTRGADRGRPAALCLTRPLLFAAYRGCGHQPRSDLGWSAGRRPGRNRSAGPGRRVAAVAGRARTGAALLPGQLHVRAR